MKLLSMNCKEKIPLIIWIINIILSVNIIHNARNAEMIAGLYLKKVIGYSFGSNLNQADLLNFDIFSMSLNKDGIYILKPNLYFYSDIDRLISFLSMSNYDIVNIEMKKTSSDDVWIEALNVKAR